MKTLSNEESSKIEGNKGPQREDNGNRTKENGNILLMEDISQSISAHFWGH